MKKSKLLLINGILSSAYTIYIITYFISNMNSSTDSAEQVGAGIAAFLVAPHAFVTLLAAIFCWLAYFLNKSGFALTAAILFCVAAGLFIPYAMFLLPSIIIGFIAYSKVKKSKAAVTVNP